MLLCCACGAPNDGATKATTEAPSSSPTAVPDEFTNRIWLRSDSAGLPGVMVTFLSDSVLLMDSCWETYRVTRWRRSSDSTVIWQEDRDTLEAVVHVQPPNHMVLQVATRGGIHMQRYTRLDTAFVCPDMKR